MSSTEQSKSGGKSGRRNRKGQRAKREADHVPAAEPQPVPAVQIEPVAAAPAPVDTVPVSLQTIANAYRDYTRKSFAEFGSYVEQLSGVRSLDNAVVVQSEFVKRAYATSVAESQKICELHGKLARQTLQPFRELTNKGAETRGKS
jgi:hypothetical protein